MFVFATAITKPDVYARCAQPGIRRVAEADSVVLAQPAVGSIARSYNHLMDQAAAQGDLEALVLLHQDTEIADAGFCRTTRQALTDPEIGLLGCVGAVGVRSIAWWEGSVTLASFVNRYEEHGGGDLAALSWTWDEAPPYVRIGEVETLDGFLLVMSPWTVANVRFDETLSDFHGYDLDICLQVREQGRKVATADFRAIHHRPLEMIPDLEPWVSAHVATAEKWDGRMPGIGTGPGTWEERARRAEAEADAARTLAYSTSLEGIARTRQLQNALDDARSSVSWRLTAPLRMLARARGARN